MSGDSTDDGLVIPSVYNLRPLLTDGKTNRQTRIGRFEVPQRYFRPALYGAGLGMLALATSVLFGPVFTDWRVLVVLLAAGRFVVWQTRRRRERLLIRFYVRVATAVLLLFPIAGLVGGLLSFAPVVGGFLSSLSMVLIGGLLGVASFEARSRSGSDRLTSMVAQGRSGSMSSTLHLGLWPVPEVERVVEWRNGAAPNPNYRTPGRR